MKKAYPKYREINLPWQSRIPEGWDLKRAKFLFKTIDLRSKTGEETLLSVSEHHGVIPRSQVNVTMFQAESYEGYKLCEKGDLVINSLWAWSRGLGFSEYHGIISTAYDVFRLKNSEDFFYPFFNYLLRTKFYVGEYLKRSKGIWISRLQLSASAFLEIPILLPPLPEQCQIAAFLDHKCALIDTFIQKKTRLIELLKEQKQAIINKAVTKGIDPRVRLRPSGVEWLGDIPEGWEVKKLKYVANLKSGSNLTSEVIQEEGLYPVYGGNGLRGYYPEFTHEGDYILIGRQGALCGNINYANGKFWPTEHAWVVNIKSGGHWFWLGELLRAMNLNQYSQSAAQPGLSLDNIKNLPMPVPSLRDQRKIAEYLEKEFEKIAKTISQLEKVITLLQEYKTTLIAEAVTGKIDVRDWRPNAAELTDKTAVAYDRETSN